MDKIDNIITEEVRAKRIKIIKQLLPWLLLIAGLLLWNLYLDTEDVVEEQYIYGVVINSHQKQSHLGSTGSRFTVILENGTEVYVHPKENTPFLKNKRVKIIKYTMDSGRIYYSFLGYTDESS